ncbi:DUF6624 domain-containing protein [Telluribacter sp. SYSU D00476]|uniref:DUF6624 domain-containing protein n=1 Tax=Telluribacter sp. SYSU D00476 TaxID=2811430 RepID=UPI001FF28439|nr:DUF6624 domain-containing protein [Telluribacter sp. SYSU D00476]
MKHFILLVSFLWIVSRPAVAQEVIYATQDSVYINAVEAALKALKEGDCTTCLAQYKRAFLVNHTSALSTLRAAVCAYQCQQQELALVYLKEALTLDWEASEYLWEEHGEIPELAPLRTSALATNFESFLDERKIAAGRNPSLERELAVILEADRTPRLKIDTLGREYGFDSPLAKTVWKEIARADSVNLPKIERIIKKYGYPGKSLVGEEQSMTAWLVVQHAALAIQEKYLPLIQQAAEQGELDKSCFALLQDRIRVFKGKKQLYGTQVDRSPDGKTAFVPIEDEPNVNKRRAEVGLPPLEEYAKDFGFEYVVPKE